MDRGLSEAFTCWRSSSLRGRRPRSRLGSNRKAPPLIQSVVSIQHAVLFLIHFVTASAIKFISVNSESTVSHQCIPHLSSFLVRPDHRRLFDLEDGEEKSNNPVAVLCRLFLLSLRHNFSLKFPRPWHNLLAWWSIDDVESPCCTT